MPRTSSALPRRPRTALERANLAFFGLFFDGRILARNQEEVGPKSTLGAYGRAFWRQRILGFNRRAPFPVAVTTTIANYENVEFGDRQLANLRSPGCYLSNHRAKISFGRGVWLGPNVGLITANHDPQRPQVHLDPEPIRIDDNCWIGMNSVILPGVHLGPRTTVGAGSVVTRSFPDGYCVIAGNPARIIREFDRPSEVATQHSDPVGSTPD